MGYPQTYPNVPNANRRMVYYQTNTKNQSFIDMAVFLERKGIKNNKFHLVLFDPDLYNVDPHDPNLSVFMQKKVAHECMINYWYFLREVIRISDQGGNGKPYGLHRGNLALNYCLVRNLNIFIELPRQFGKTIGMCCRLLWVFLFGTTNSEIALLNKKHDDSKLNLSRIRDLRDNLPPYLQLRANYGVQGNKLKDKDGGKERLINDLNGNKIVTFAAARSKVNADSLGRGCTQPIQWYDEYAFIPFNKFIFLSATPAYSTASKNAMQNGAPYGIVISTTPGDLTTDSGMDAFVTKEMATDFSELWYDMPDFELQELLSRNTDSTFVYIKFTYKQLGAGEAYLDKMIREMKKEWAAIRREVLLEWAEASDNSPFTKEDLDRVKNFIKDPIATIKLCKYYELKIYEPVYYDRYPPIIGVDVSGGLKRDSSAISVIDSKTTKLVAELNCNYISPKELAACVVELVTIHAPTAVVNVERNGGHGLAVLRELKDSPIKNNLYFEYKERVVEERYDGVQMHRRKVNTKVYGLDSSKNVRDDLMEILRQRVESHKDKFISPTVYNELRTLEVKKSGKIEHTSNGHDDQLFSYLMALYVWYNGKDLMNNWGISKSTLKTDENLDEDIVTLEDKYQGVYVGDNIDEHYHQTNGEENIIGTQMDFINQAKAYTQREWYTKQYLEDEQAYINLISTPVGMKAHREKFNLTDEEVQVLQSKYQQGLPIDVYNNFHDGIILANNDNKEDDEITVSIFNNYTNFN